MSACDRLFSAISRRCRYAAAARCAWRAWLVVVGAALLLLIASRLLGFAAGWFSLQAMAALAIVAVAFGALIARSPDRRAAARLADARLAGDDLLLTASQLPAAAAGLGAVVAQQAELRAAQADPRRIVPWHPWRRLAAAAGLGAVLCAVTLWMPQLDPFDRMRQEQLREERQLAAAAAQTAAQQQLAAILAEHPQAEHSAAVEGALDQLLATLGERSADRTQRLDALDAQRRSLSAALDRADERALPAQADRAMQRVGELDPASVAGLRQALASGQAEQLKQAVAQAAELAKRMAAQDPAARAETRRALQQQLEQLARTLAGGGAAAQAMQQALDRLADSADPELTEAAMAALQSELDLAAAAGDGLAQGARDREALRQALETVRLAKACADCEGDGEGEGARPGSLAAYRAMYEQLRADQGGQGQGMGPRPGQGTGGQAAEQPDAETAFSDERSRSQQTAGKIVASWQVPGAQERGTVVEAYRERLQAARREVSDAVAGEDLPPAYRDAVKAYFDDLTPAAE